MPLTLATPIAPIHRQGIGLADAAESGHGDGGNGGHGGHESTGALEMKAAVPVAPEKRAASKGGRR